MVYLFCIVIVFSYLFNYIDSSSLYVYSSLLPLVYFISKSSYLESVSYKFFKVLGLQYEVAIRYFILFDIYISIFISISLLPILIFAKTKVFFVILLIITSPILTFSFVVFQRPLRLLQTTAFLLLYVLILFLIYYSELLSVCLYLIIISYLFFKGKEKFKIIEEVHVNSK